MNKNNRRTLPMVMALLVMVTAMCAVGSADIVAIDKAVLSIDPMDDGTAFYDLHTGDSSIIEYDIEVQNMDIEAIHVTSIADIVPYLPGSLCNGDIESLSTPYDLAMGESEHHVATYEVTLDDLNCIQNYNGHGDIVEGDVILITNHASVCAHNSSNIPACPADCATVSVKVINTSAPPPPVPDPPPTDVPAHSTIGIAAMIGMLGIIGAGRIIGRK